ncbi:penicillin amidase [Synechococcus sp. BS56D]|uniref:DUF6554 family protein n=1 Tax=Synechococcus sp. BS56D TaxID=2055944 RepID=UPI001040E02E|nr:DUF6554 family protein [Synechococcus sp. BS56D]TCD59104.1 penicillin amidase [Synechococcus sp. BS56D]
MARIQIRLATVLTLAGLAGLNLVASGVKAADKPEPNKGAQIYCFMRSNGNDHSVSWEASYALIKRQGNSVFKTSPEHAAVMITEAVVKDPGSYPDCGRYLGDLFGGSDRSAKLPQDQPKAKSSSSGSYSNTYGDQRYSY